MIHGTNWTTLRIPKAVAKAGAFVADALQGGEAFIKPFIVNMADDHRKLNITQAKQLLDWEPQHCLRHELPKLIAALKASGCGLSEPQTLASAFRSCAI